MLQRHDKQSRRQVQRRFPPGSFIIDDSGRYLGFVLGWGPTASTLRPSIVEPGTVVGDARSWIVYFIKDNRVSTLPWYNVRECYNLEEWEDDF
jgi:hypothetical protein